MSKKMIEWSDETGVYKVEYQDDFKGLVTVTYPNQATVSLPAELVKAVLIKGASPVIADLMKRYSDEEAIEDVLKAVLA